MGFWGTGSLSLKRTRIQTQLFVDVEPILCVLPVSSYMILNSNLVVTNP